MSVDFLLERFARHRDDEAVIWDGNAYTYADFLNEYELGKRWLKAAGVGPGSVISIHADFSPRSMALFLALTELRTILVPLSDAIATQREEFLDIAQAEAVVVVDRNDALSIESTGRAANHALYTALREREHPGLVLFSSGSTGKSKASVHDLISLVQKFKVHRHSIRTIPFLLFDHIGGVNTMLYTLSNAGCLVTVPNRDPHTVLAAIEKYRVALLPTSPTYMNLILLSDAHQDYDLSSLKTVTYGTEPMPASTLARFHDLLPGCRLLQTYGLSEVGILRSKSRSSDSLWVKIGGDGFETRVVDNILHIRAESAMLGYLNAPSPFTGDGWMVTGDEVEQDGEYFLIKGRRSELINIGGLKVYPSEVESVIQEMPNVRDVTARGAPNPITGEVVCVTVSLIEPEPRKAFRTRMLKHCRRYLQPHKIPVKVEITDQSQFSSRFKRTRRVDTGG